MAKTYTVYTYEQDRYDETVSIETVHSQAALREALRQAREQVEAEHAHLKTHHAIKALLALADGERAVYFTTDTNQVVEVGVGANTGAPAQASTPTPAALAPVQMRYQQKRDLRVLFF